MQEKNKIVIIRNKNEINFASKFLKEKIHDYLFIPISLNNTSVGFKL